ncbi:MAG: hypothetical protein NZ516_08260, partial [Raineya sp.]|nr:hypothetical protein [Raineya sp.]
MMIIVLIIVGLVVGVYSLMIVYFAWRWSNLTPQLQRRGEQTSPPNPLSKGEGETNLTLNFSPKERGADLTPQPLQRRGGQTLPPNPSPKERGADLTPQPLRRRGGADL